MTYQRIDYSKMRKKITNNKYKTLNKTKQIQHTCEYSEGEKHSLCTHKNNCILKINRQINDEINFKQKELKNLKKSLRHGLKLMNENPDKKSNELKVGFYPAQLRLDIKLMENELRKLRKQEIKYLMELKQA